MKLLLTSAGIINKSITNALISLMDKDPEDATMTVIPTASTIVTGDKSWLIEDLNNLKKLGFKSIEITDISVIDKDIWMPSLERADVLFFEGGNTYYLMHWIKKLSLDETLKDLLNDKVYIGVSAGSMIVSPDLNIKLYSELYDEENIEIDSINGLAFTDFYFLPHLNSDAFPLIRKKNIEKVSNKVSKEIYALDDNSALKIVDGKVEVISEGTWLKY